MRSDYPIADIWHANCDADGVSDGGERVFEVGAAGALVTRPHLAVTVRALQPAAFTFAETLLGGAGLDTAHESAFAADDAFDVMTVFRDLLSAGAFRDIAAVVDQTKEG